MKKRKSIFEEVMEQVKNRPYFRKPIALPDWELLPAIKSPYNGAKKPKWKVTPSIKEEYRIKAKEIMQYDWSYTFMLKSSGSDYMHSINIFYGSWSDQYQVCYQINNTNAVVLFVNYEDMTFKFLTELLCQCVKVKGHENS